MTGDIEKRILDAYTRLHEFSVIHGDIRPENILILKDGSVRIIDFDCGLIVPPGLANLLTQENHEISKMFDELKGNGISCAHDG